MTASADFLLRRLRLRHLQLLVLLAQEGSLRGAATLLNLTQPAVTKMLHEIEQAFGGRLFDRGRRGVEANAQGLAAVHYARLILNEVDRVASEVKALQGGAVATLRLGTLSITSIVPSAVVDLCTRMPGAHVRITEGAMHGLLPQLQEGEIDCVFGAITAETLAAPSIASLHAEVIFKDRLCALVSEEHPLAGQGPLHWRELAGMRWAAPPRYTQVGQQFAAAFLHLGIEPPDPVVETLSPVTLVELLRRDPTLIAAVRDESTRFEVLSGLRRLEIVPRVSLPPLCVFTRRPDAPTTAIVAEFLQSLRRAARTMRTSRRPRAGSGPRA